MKVPAALKEELRLPRKGALAAELALLGVEDLAGRLVCGQQSEGRSVFPLLIPRCLGASGTCFLLAIT